MMTYSPLSQTPDSKSRLGVPDSLGAVQSGHSAVEATMIEKITKLAGIGVLHLPIPNPPLFLKKRTIIYAENGRGKTTFVSMLRSLSTGDTSELKQRETLKGSASQIAELICQGKNHSLAQFIWNETQIESVEFCRSC